MSSYCSLELFVRWYSRKSISWARVAFSHITYGLRVFDVNIFNTLKVGHSDYVTLFELIEG